MATSTTKKVGAGAAVVAAAAATMLWTSQPPAPSPNTQYYLGAGCQPVDTVCELPCAIRETYPSRLCMACHSDTIAYNNHPTSSTAGLSVLGGTDHPVDILVLGVPGIKQAIDPHFVLQDGLMSCTTCHNYWAVPRQPKWMAVSDQVICVGCHEK